MRSDRRVYHPCSRDALERRLRLRHGLSEQMARLVATLQNGGGGRG